MMLPRPASAASSTEQTSSARRDPLNLSGAIKIFGPVTTGGPDASGGCGMAI
jgi:hypothetical protein